MRCWRRSPDLTATTPGQTPTQWQGRECDTCPTSAHADARFAAAMSRWPRQAKGHAGVLTQISSCLAPWGGHVEAGTPTHYHPAGHDPRRGH
jgi:hypothetical protein